MQERDDRQGEYEAADVGHPRRGTEIVQLRCDRVVDCGFGDRAQQQRAGGDAELRPGEQQGQFAGTAQCRPGGGAGGRGVFQRLRRAAINANSTATKNALEAISTTVIRATTQGLVIVAPVADVDGDVHRRRHSAFDRADLRGQPARWCRPFTEQVCGVCG